MKTANGCEDAVYPGFSHLLMLVSSLNNMIFIQRCGKAWVDRQHGMSDNNQTAKYRSRWCLAGVGVSAASRGV